MPNFAHIEINLLANVATVSHNYYVTRARHCADGRRELVTRFGLLSRILKYFGLVRFDQFQNFDPVKNVKQLLSVLESIWKKSPSN